jgi:glycosyltransferase involved in cell wall biosynthesis
MGFRLVHVTTVPKSFIFLRDQIGFMSARGVEVIGVSSPGEDLERTREVCGIETHALEMPRRISPAQDLATVARLAALLRRLRPDVVHAHTPKGGLLGMLAATAAGVPVRVYHMRGLPMMTATGWRRELLTWTERVSCGLAHHCLCVSHSLRDVAIAERLCPASRIEVIAGGSGQGVDARGRFDPTSRPAGERARLRDELGIPPDAVVVGFVGRLVRDKGVGELADAWARLSARYPEAHLVVVGDYEERDAVGEETRALLEDAPRVHMLGWRDDVPTLYSAFDLVTLPTYREGFPNVPLEAAAMSLPVVATRVPGCVDAVDDARTGLLVPARDARALEAAIERYLDDAELRRAHGEAGRARALAAFDPELIYEGIHGVYTRLRAQGSRHASS